MRLLSITSLVLLVTILAPLCPAPFIPAIIAAVDAAIDIAVEAGTDAAFAASEALGDSAAEAGISSEVTEATQAWQISNLQSAQNFLATIGEGRYAAAETDLIAAAQNGEISPSQFDSLSYALKEVMGNPGTFHHYRRAAPY